MKYLGSGPTKRDSLSEDGSGGVKNGTLPQKRPNDSNDTIDEAKKLAAAALSAVREVAASASGRGKVEVMTLPFFFFFSSGAIYSMSYRCQLSGAIYFTKLGLVDETNGLLNVL